MELQNSTEEPIAEGLLRITGPESLKMEGEEEEEDSNEEARRRGTKLSQ